MICCGNKEHPGIMVNMSRCTGACVGTVAATGKKITRVVGSGVVAVGHLLTRPVEVPELIAAEQKNSTKSLISALESDLAAASGQLQELQGKSEKTQFQIASQLRQLQSEKQSLLTELEQARNQANEAAVQAREARTQTAVLETTLAATGHNLEKSAPHFDEQISVKTKEQPSQAASEEVEMPGPPAVTDEQVQAAVFGKVTDKILFAKALSDIASDDAAVRLDAVKTMAGIGHELSVKALAAQMAPERSPQVRQECIKALTTLGMKEALPAVEHALTDEADLVRLAAVWGLYHLAGAECGPALIRTLSDEDEEVRRRAATCIGWLGQEESAGGLIPLLNDSSVPVRRAAAEAIGNLGNRQVVSSMIEHLKDTDKATRKNVLGAIERITGKKIGKSLPRNEADLDRLIARWQQWWKEDMSK